MKTFHLLLIVVVVLLACKGTPTPVEGRLYVVQEIKLDDNNSFFWFRDEQEIMHEGLSYFQIAGNKCDLSIKNANASCELPSQILDVRNDTIFILTRSRLDTINLSKKYTLNVVHYRNDLFDLRKKPTKENMYFLDSVCH